MKKINSYGAAIQGVDQYPHQAKVLREIAESAIAPEISEAAIGLLPDVEYDTLQGENLGTPLYDALGWKIKTQWQTNNPGNRLGMAFTQESGEVWQVKVFGDVNPKSGKSGQYFAPKESGDIPFLPLLPRGAIQAIARKYGTPPPEPGESFWAWFQAHPEIPLIITEGGKKSLALFSLGFVAISLFGCTCGRVKTDDGLRVKDALLPYIRGRAVTIAFDQDTKPRTIKKVWRATQTLAGALYRSGAAKVAIALWDGFKGKGIDDLAGYDAGLARRAINGAIPSHYADIYRRGILSPDVRFSSRFVGDVSVNIPEGVNILGIKAAKFTGKTHCLVEKVQAAINSGTPVFVVTHRIQLARHLCDRFGLDHIDSMGETGHLLGFGFCIDSFHPESKARFSPEMARGALIVIDEADQVFWHLLGGNTCKDKRIKILETFSESIRVATGSGGMVILSSADLAPHHIRYVESLSENPKTFTIENTYNPIPGKRVVHLYQSEGHLIGALRRAIANGEKVIIHLSAQKEKSNYSTVNLEKLLRGLFPELKILRIDSHSVGDPSHPAYGCMEDINEITARYDIVIASPTIETGVSLENNHFDSVWQIANGVQTVDAVLQTTGRVRSDVPRHLFIAKRSRQEIGNGGTYPKTLLDSTDTLFAYTVGKLFLAELKAGGGGHLDTWATMAADHNQGFLHYREMVETRLEIEGYVLDFVPLDSELSKGTHQAIKENEEISDREYRGKVAITPNPNDHLYQELQKKRNKTEPEHMALHKGALCRRYLSEEISPELIKEDDGGLYPKLQLLYFLTMGRCFLESRDKRVLGQLSHGGEIFTPDATKAALSPKIRVLEAVLDKLPAPGSEVTGDDLAQWFGDYVKPAAKDIKLGLGVWLGNVTPTQAAQAIFSKVGLKMRRLGQFRRGGQRVRTYLIPERCPSESHHKAILSRWLERDNGPGFEPVTPPPVKDEALVKTGGVTPLESPTETTKENMAAIAPPVEIPETPGGLGVAPVTPPPVKDEALIKTGGVTPSGTQKPGETTKENMAAIAPPEPPQKIAKGAMVWAWINGVWKKATVAQILPGISWDDFRVMCDGGGHWFNLPHHCENPPLIPLEAGQ